MLPILRAIGYHISFSKGLFTTPVLAVEFISLRTYCLMESLMVLAIVSLQVCACSMVASLSVVRA
jgi:hypothetical protein